MPQRLKAKSASKKAVPIASKPISDKLHKIVHVITRPEFGKYGKNLKTADDVIAYYGHGLANLIGKFEGKRKKKDATEQPEIAKQPEKEKDKYTVTGPFKDKKDISHLSTVKQIPNLSKNKTAEEPKSVKALPAPKMPKMPDRQKPFKAPAPKMARKALPSSGKKLLTGPVQKKLLPAPKQKKMLAGPTQVKTLPAPKSTAVGRPLPMQKRLPSKEKIIGSGSSYAAKTQGMPTPKKSLPAPQKQLPQLESVAGNKAIETYREKLYEYSLKQFGSDASDAARGFAKGITFGTSDNIEAGAKSLVKGTSYKSELNKAKQANVSAEKRSPTLYGAGELAGSVAAPVPGAAAIKGISAATKLGKAAKVGAHIGSSMATQSAVDKVKSIAEPKIGTMVRPSKPKPMFKSPIPKPVKFGN